MFTIGVRAHDLGKKSLAELASTLQELHIGSIQLAINKALSDRSYHPGSLSPGFARTINKTLASHGADIAVLGAYVNLIHPDKESRNRELQKFIEHLRYARDFGTSIVGTETGHRSPDGTAVPETQSQEAFNDLVDSVSRLTEAAAHYGVLAGIEPVADKHPLSSIERTVSLIERVNSPNLGIIFDPVNLIPSAGISDQDDFLKSAFQAFGPHICCIHAKDFRIENGTKIGTLPAGTGDLNYPLLAGLISEVKPGIHVLLENTAPDNLPVAIDFLHGLSCQNA